MLWIIRIWFKVNLIIKKTTIEMALQEEINLKMEEVTIWTISEIKMILTEEETLIIINKKILTI